MSISDIRAFLAERSNLADLSRQQNLRTEIQDNRQATGAQGSRVSLSTSLSISSQSFIGARVLTNGFNQSLSVSDQRPNFSLPDNNEPSGFDFEEVARNVLGFVGSVIRGAQTRGEDDDELLDLFQQARRGVETGIGQAIDDLEGFLDDDIQEGINNSRNLIEQGIADIERDIFSPSQSTDQQVIENETRIEQSISVSEQRSGDLRIRTRDGDEVRIRFEDIQQFQQTQSLLLQTRVEQNNQTASEVTEQTTTGDGGRSETQNINSNTEEEVQLDSQGDQVQQTPVQNVPQSAVSGETGGDNSGNESEGDNVEADSAAAAVVNEPNAIPADRDAIFEQNIEVESNSLFFESNSFSFSVVGELDEAELQAIGALVSDTASLASEFFDGDIDAAFERALELGFDETELTGFALQLDSIQQTRVTQTYQSVSEFSDSDEANQQERVSSVRPVADYLSDLLSVFEQSRQLLQNSETFNDLINDVFNRVLQIETPDLVNALNRFNSFNERLLNNASEASEDNVAGTTI